ncbi:teleost multiple tissue opsin b isoform X1 [Takifugu flavidus]|uniref:teleost multiple tissue opsin b isoform X1 n=1 Tax=Takifugu flavidus TaxID=433684 RepID=UPI002544B734|nr:teleost multiple tissue opsin b isoform X1 [Takifugu flavidus]
MIVCNVSLSCAHCPGEGTAANDAYAQASGSLATPTLSQRGHLVVAVCLGFIGTVGFLSNFLVLALFCRYRALRTPMNLMLVSISASDLLVSVLGTPFSFAASTQGRWLIGRAGCVWYGFVNACLGIVSLISLAVLSYERYCTMVSSTIASNRDYRPVLGGICFSWFYSLAWTVPPLLGWSRYGPEGPGTTCSVDWRTQTPNNISYIVCLFTFCLLLPFFVILYSYGKLLHTIRQVRRVSSTVTRRREHRVLVMVVAMVVCYLICWLPYGVTALLATFGPPNLLTPEATITPSLLAKFSTVINPFIYIFMNKQVRQVLRHLRLFVCEVFFYVFCTALWEGAHVGEGLVHPWMTRQLFAGPYFYRCFRAFLNCSTPKRDSTVRTFTRISLRALRQDQQQKGSALAPSSARPTPNSIHESSLKGSHSTPSNGGAAAAKSPAANRSKPKLILVAHYRE